VAFDPRAEARDILAEDRFRRDEPPRPFRDLFRELGDALQSLANGLPGDPPAGWALLALAVLLVAGGVAIVGVRRRAGQAPARERPESGGPARAVTAAELERRAQAADRAGDFSAAVRLRFHAGLMRLHERRAIELRPSLTSGGVARELRSERFDRLAAEHDEIAYGGRAAGAGDSEAARELWPAVVDEATRGVRR